MRQCGTDEGRSRGGDQGRCGQDAVEAPVASRSPSVGDGRGLDEGVDAAGQAQDHAECDQQAYDGGCHGQRRGGDPDGGHHGYGAHPHRGRGREAGVPEAAEDLTDSAEPEGQRGGIAGHALLDEHRHQVDEDRERGKGHQGVRGGQQCERPTS